MSDTAPCPACQREIYADAFRCPHCGDYVTPGTIQKKPRPIWIWIGLALTGFVLLLWILTG